MNKKGDVELDRYPRARKCDGFDVHNPTESLRLHRGFTISMRIKVWCQHTA